MPKYINIMQGGSPAQGKYYRENEIATFGEAYAKTKKNSWMLLSEFERIEENQREKSALKESSVEKIKRLEHELAQTKAAVSKSKKQEEKLLDSGSDYHTELQRAKDLGYNGPKTKVAIYEWLEKKDKEDVSGLDKILEGAK